MVGTMKVGTNEANPGGIGPELQASTIFDLLSDQRRRYVLHYLTRRIGAVNVGEVAEQIVLWEDEPTRDRYERVCTALVHTHLPKLRDAGVVDYCPALETVGVRDDADRLAPYLRLAASDDFRSTTPP